MKNLFEAVDIAFEQTNVIIDEAAELNNRIEALKVKVQEHRALNEAKKLEEVEIDKQEQSKNN